MEDKKMPAHKVAEKMIARDRFMQWLGIELLEVRPGSCILQMRIREEMINFFGVGHGGVTFSLADSALAIACNSHDRLSMALDTSMSFLAKVRQDDVLTARAEEVSLGNKTATYDIRVRNQSGRTMAHFKATVYRTSESYLATD